MDCCYTYTRGDVPQPFNVFSQDRVGRMDSMEAQVLRAVGAALEPLGELVAQAGPEQQVIYFKLSHNTALADF